MSVSVKCSPSPPDGAKPESRRTKRSTTAVNNSEETRLSMINNYIIHFFPLLDLIFICLYVYFNATSPTLNLNIYIHDLILISALFFVIFNVYLNLFLNSQ